MIISPVQKLSYNKWITRLDMLYLFNFGIPYIDQYTDYTKTYHIWVCGYSPSSYFEMLFGCMDSNGNTYYLQESLNS